MTDFHSNHGAIGSGKRLGPYTLIKRLAVGGMAEVFLALHKSSFGFEKLVVIKCVLPEIAEKPEIVEMLLHEARTVAAISHPNVVQIYDVGEAYGRHFIAMEHAHGEDLRAIVREMRAQGTKTFPLEGALAIVSAAAMGLAHAHEQLDLTGRPLGIVHRDISPQNIVITYSGEVKIVDFGIVQSFTFDETKSLGQLKGKIPYMSPEQARGEPVDARSDVFSLGIILFELTTGKRLFKAPSEYEALKLICEYDYPKPRDIRPDYPAGLERIIERALAKNRSDRYPSARELSNDLDAFIRTHGLAGTTSLREFMQRLFESKLIAERRAIAEGKALADLVHAREEGELEFTMERKPLSVPPFALTIPPETPSSSMFDSTRFGTTRRLATWSGLGLLGALAGVGVVHFATGGDLASLTQPLESTPAIAKPLALREAVSVAGQVEVAVKPETANAKVELDGVEQEGLSFVVPLGEEHTISVSAPGYIAQITNVRGAIRETKRVSIELEREPTTSISAPTAATRQPSSPAATPVAAQAPASAQSPAAAVAASVAATPTGTGTLNVATPTGTGTLNVGTTSAWCNVTIDGTPKGATPVAGIELSAGPHKVICTTEDGRSLVAQVNVAAGTVTRQKFKLE